MKRLSVLMAVCLIGISISAQTFLKKSGSFHSLGRQYDTLVQSQTHNYTLELGDDVFGVMTIALESDTISGTSAYTSYLQYSLNGEDYINADTITHTGGNPDYAEFSPVNTDHTFWRVRTIATATAQRSILKIHGRVDEHIVIQ